MARLDSLIIFTTVVKANNFTNAAHQLGLTPSAVSKQISLLEDRLGVRLLNRTTRSVSPTEAGQLFFNRCSRLLEDLEEAEHMVKDLETSPRGTLKISATPTFGRAMLMKIFAKFLEQYPDVNFDLTLADKGMDLVREGIDLAIHLGSLQDSRLVARPVARQKVIIVASKEYLEKHGRPETLQELTNHYILMVSGIDFAEPRWIKRFLKEAALINKDRRFTVNDLDALCEATLNDMGISALPYYMIREHIESGKLVNLLPEVNIPTRTIHVVYPENRYLSAKSRAFVDFMANYFIEHNLDDV
ncbi:LysR substrate-binding domain-containing protein [Reinekea marina]|uniref:LysR substrate-binding domain-containing protein n=1 Tax=Reinekea marina TaxID=1310421 RepID=A0ABV7WPI2_9GAMM|nr:LysR family transcriptional regulator [Reinekea marina]MDN3649384.1 LysR substrate-binding domain-containing protein [Reinekea marina]